MRWSWQIARVAGIGIYVHVTFLILLAWAFYSDFLPDHNWQHGLIGVGFILALFTIIVMHELGHALAARRYGIRTRDITLLPIGGLARLERIPEEPAQELVVALAGPAVNVVLAGLFFTILAADGELLPFGHTLTTVDGVWTFLNKMMWVNVFLVVFNMLPAFPMDGGRVLRALLALRMDYVHATQVAAAIGQGMALLFGLLGLIGGGPMLLLIALFVWMGAASEANLVEMRSALGGIPVNRAMITRFRTLAPAEPLARAVEYMLGGFQQDFPVVEEGRLVGVLTRHDLIAALARSGPDTPVGEVMRTEFATADEREMLEGAFARLQGSGSAVLPVLHDGELVGILTSENLGEFLMIRSALKQREQQHQAETRQRGTYRPGWPGRGEPVARQGAKEE